MVSLWPDDMSARTLLMASAMGGNPPSLDLSFMAPGVLDPRITLNRASLAGTYFDSTGVMRTAGYNYTSNNMMAGAVPGTPGTLPTNWVVSSLPAGLSQQVVGTGVQNGISYIDLRFFGTATTAGNFFPLSDGGAGPSTSAGVSWTISSYLALVAGSVTNLTVMQLANNFLPSGVVFTNIPLNGTLTRYAATSAAPAGTTGLQQAGPFLIINVALGPIDFTLRWGMPQLEQSAVATPPIATSGTPNGAPRWDYDPMTRKLLGVLIEETRTNITFSSGDLSNTAYWTYNGFNGSAAPVVTGNQAIAPDGTMAAARVVFPAVSGVGAGSQVVQGRNMTANPFTSSLWLRGNVGGEQLYMWVLDGSAVTYYRTLVTLTTAWQRFSFSTPALTAAFWYPCFGVDLRDAGQSAKPAQTVFAWGAQVEQGADISSYIPTTTVAVTRQVEQCYIIPLGAWYNAANYSIGMEFDTVKTSALVCAISTYGSFTDASYVIGGGFNVAGGGSIGGVPGIIVGAINKECVSVAPTRIAISNMSGVVSSGPNGAPAQSAANLLGIGNSSWGLDNQLSGHMRRLRFWPRTLSDNELREMTT